MCQHCIWTSRRNHSFSLGLRCPLPTFELCSFLTKCSPFFLPGLPFQIEQDGWVLLGALLCPVLEKIIAEGWGQPSRCCQSYSRKPETGSVHLHGTKSRLERLSATVLEDLTGVANAHGWGRLYTQVRLSTCQMRLVGAGKYRPHPEHFNSLVNAVQAELNWTEPQRHLSVIPTRGHVLGIHITLAVGI